MFTKITFTSIAFAFVFLGAACERHTIEETKYFSKGHHADHDDKVSAPAHGHATEQADQGHSDDHVAEPEKEPKRFMDR